MKQLKKIFLFLLQITITSGLLVLISRKIGLERLLETAQRVELWLVFVLAFFISLLGLLQTLRWRLVLDHLNLGRLNFRGIYLYRTVFLSIGVMQVLPGIVGADAIRISGLVSRGIRVKDAIMACALDRVFAISALVLLACVSLPYQVQLYSQEPWMAILMLLLTLGGLIGMFVIVFVHKHFDSERLPRILRFFHEISKECFGFLKDRRKLLMAVLYSFLIQLGYVIVFAIIVHSLGIDIDILTHFIFLPLILLVGFLPISVGGWGVRDATAITLYGLVGISHDEIAVSTLVYGLAMLIGGQFSILLWFVLRFWKEKTG